MLAWLGAAGAACLLSGHTPYRQWTIMRQRFLLVFTSREDPASDVLGEDIARVLLRNLPASRAQVVRGPTNERVASLLATQQADVAVLSRANAFALMHADAPFSELPPTPVRVLVETPSHQFVCREDFPRHHGYLVAEALIAERAALGIEVPDREAGSPAARDAVPTHAGALAYLRGEPVEAP